MFLIDVSPVFSLGLQPAVPTHQHSSLFQTSTAVKSWAYLFKIHSSRVFKKSTVGQNFSLWLLKQRKLVTGGSGQHDDQFVQIWLCASKVPAQSISWRPNSKHILMKRSRMPAAGHCKCGHVNFACLSWHNVQVTIRSDQILPEQKSPWVSTCTQSFKSRWRNKCVCNKLNVQY